MRVSRGNHLATKIVLVAFFVWLADVYGAVLSLPGVASAITKAIDKPHLLVFMPGLRGPFSCEPIFAGIDSYALSYEFILYKLGVSFC